MIPYSFRVPCYNSISTIEDIWKVVNFLCIFQDF